MNIHSSKAIIDRCIAGLDGRSVVTPIERLQIAERILDVLTQHEIEAVADVPRFDHDAADNAPTGKFVDWLLDIRLAVANA